MKVYRFEKDGKGPYINGHCSVIKDRVTNLYTEENHPCPHTSFFQTKWRRSKARHYLYGCSSKEALYCWFGFEAIRIFRRLGYVVMEYDIPDNERGLYISDHQCAFPINKYGKRGKPLKISQFFDQRS